MSDNINAQGRCLCGTVTVTTKTLNPDVGACHCTMCRKWTGGPFMAVDCGTAVSFEGGDHISVYNSSEWAERGFCNQCGTHLFYRLKENQQYIMPVGLFDGVTEDQGLVFDHQIFIDEKPDFYDFANETRNMTGKEVFEQFMGGSE